MFSLALLAVAFMSGFIMDIIWTWCVAAITAKRPLAAANFGTLLYLCTIISTILIVEHHFSAVVAYALGGWFGTYFAVSFKPTKQKGPVT